MERIKTMLDRLHSRCAVAAALIALFLWALSGAATAHSLPESTVPANGAVVDAAPKDIVISFDKPMRVTIIELTNESGDAFTLGRTDGMAPVMRFQATPTPLPGGNYTVQWRGLSQDGHPMSGHFSFEIRP